MSFPAPPTKKRFRSLREREALVFGFARRSGARVTFCFGRKSPKTTAPGMTVFADIVSAQLPLVLAERQPRRTHTSLCSDMRRLLCRSAARRGVMQRRGEKALLRCRSS
ncbi:MAG: hypothetical protein ACREPK_00605 [Rhodanobacteraceae bacterium]